MIPPLTLTSSASSCTAACPSQVWHERLSGWARCGTNACPVRQERLSGWARCGTNACPVWQERLSGVAGTPVRSGRVWH
ncbi:hypothetical protein GCM10011366_20190 [Ornithinimicrobium tianjinense]|uniref:Uncharacterized protein n=1 Tax=Ornithinimicrobium tianjinense TaxID=1195761 RepID=A0A917F6E5_9MICO|nr:hypothetical protein GCM10011366_20190 [Ornithinimicrobium tianjinense]